MPVWADTLLPEDHSGPGSASTSARAAGTPPRAHLAINDREDELPQSASVHVSQEEVESWRHLANELEDAGLEYMQRLVDHTMTSLNASRDFSDMQQHSMETVRS